MAQREKLKVYRTPSFVKQYNSIEKLSDTAISVDTIVKICWNPESNVVAACSSDGNVRLYPIIHLKGVYIPTVLSNGKRIIECFFIDWKTIGKKKKKTAKKKKNCKKKLQKKKTTKKKQKKKIQFNFFFL